MIEILSVTNLCHCAKYFWASSIVYSTRQLLAVKTESFKILLVSQIFRLHQVHSFIGLISCPSGICRCERPYTFDGGVKIAQQMVDNRVGPEMRWMLEPWMGPPFDLEKSYENICELALYRLGCPSQLQQVNGLKFICDCGNFKVASDRISTLITNQINQGYLMSLPIFADPLVLSLELSIAILLLTGRVGAVVASACQLPAVVGYLLFGMAIQDIIHPSLLHGAGGVGPHSTPDGVIKTFVFVVVLIRAGLSLKIHDILKAGVLTPAMACAPYMFEMVLMLGCGTAIYGWSGLDMGKSS